MHWWMHARPRAQSGQNPNQPHSTQKGSAIIFVFDNAITSQSTELEAQKPVQRATRSTKKLPATSTQPYAANLNAFINESNFNHNAATQQPGQGQFEPQHCGAAAALHAGPRAAQHHNRQQQRHACIAAATPPSAAAARPRTCMPHQPPPAAQWHRRGRVCSRRAPAAEQPRGAPLRRSERQGHHGGQLPAIRRRGQPGAVRAGQPEGAGCGCYCRYCRVAGWLDSGVPT